MSTLRVGTLKGRLHNHFRISMGENPANYPENFQIAGSLEIAGDAQFSIPSGTTGERPTTAVAGMIRHNTTTNEAEFYDGSTWKVWANESQTGGSGALRTSGNGTASSPALSATQLKADYPNTTDGYYTYYVPNSNDTVELWTDMTRDGGGWVVVSKWGAHSKTEDKIFNVNARQTQLLTSPDFPGYGDYARLSRDHMNAIWKKSKYVCRIHLNNVQSTGSSGIYFQSKISNRDTFDFWKGHYHPHYWSDWNRNSYQATGGGTYYGVSFAVATTSPQISNYNGSNNFNSSTNTIVGGTGHQANMGWWDRATVDAPNFGKFEVARHMGFFGDISTGNQWLFTSNPSENRWPNNENKQSIVLLRW